MKKLLQLSHPEFLSGKTIRLFVIVFKTFRFIKLKMVSRLMPVNFIYLEAKDHSIILVRSLNLWPALRFEFYFFQ